MQIKVAVWVYIILLPMDSKSAFKSIILFYFYNTVVIKIFVEKNHFLLWLQISYKRYLQISLDLAGFRYLI